MPLLSVHTSMRSVAIAGLALLGLLTSACRDECVVTSESSVTSDGGTVVVQCIDGNRAKLVGWQPNRGYQARVIVPGPSAQASLIFESATAIDIRVAMHCVDSQPRMDQFEDDDAATG
jgi:hypothetical protein